MSSYAKANFQNNQKTFSSSFWPIHQQCSETTAEEQRKILERLLSTFLGLQIITDFDLYFYSEAPPSSVVMAALQYLKPKNQTAASRSQLFRNINNLGQTVLDQTI